MQNFTLGEGHIVVNPTGGTLEEMTVDLLNLYVQGLLTPLEVANTLVTNAGRFDIMLES